VVYTNVAVFRVALLVGIGRNARVLDVVLILALRNGVYAHLPALVVGSTATASANAADSRVIELITE